MRKPAHLLCGVVCAMAVASPLALRAHEADQYTLPAGREFADVGDDLSTRFYHAIARGVDKANHAIGRSGGNDSFYHTSDGIAAAVNREFPVALFLIEHLDAAALSDKYWHRYPGRLVGYKPVNDSVRRYAEFSLNPLRAWPCSTIRVYGVYLGTDKIGHFTDMGMLYYRAYRSALRGGASEEEAQRAGIAIGTDGLISEKGVLGFLTAGAYSNGDMASNYCGMLFYKNLTDPVMLKGEIRPPMLVRNEGGEGPYWRIAPHVTRTSDFFSYFISEHYDEALNPSVYLSTMRSGIRKAIGEHAEDVLEHRRDAHGNRGTPAEFAAKAKELQSYFGVYYGHKGTDDELITLAEACWGASPRDERADLAARDARGWTALHHATADGDVQRIQRLIDSGAEVDAPVRSDESRSSDWGNAPLHYAAAGGHAEAVALLIDAGADVNARSDAGVTPLHRAIGSAAIAGRLIEHGADLRADARGRTPLHWAAGDCKSAAALSVLIERATGDELNAVDRDGRSALYHAAVAGHVEGARLLIDHGADPNLVDALGLSPLHEAVRHDEAALLELLIDAGAATDVPDAFGRTPLHEATALGRDGAVATLLDHGASPSAADAYGMTPLHLASRNGHESSARLLLEAGADVLAARANSGRTPLDEAVRRKHASLVSLLRHAMTHASAAALVEAP